MKLRWEAGVENVPTFLCILQLSDTLLSTDLAREKIYSLPICLKFPYLERTLRMEIRSVTEISFYFCAFRQPLCETQSEMC